MTSPGDRPLTRPDPPPSAAGTPAPADGYVDVPAAARPLWKWRRLGAGVWLAIGLACAAYAFAAVPRYTAAATLLLEYETPRLLPFEEARDWRGWQWQDYLQTQREMLSGRTLARRVLDRTGLWAHREFAPVPRQPPPAAGSRETAVIDRFLERVRVAVVPDTYYMLSVAFTSEDPALAAVVANALAEEHVARDGEVRRSGAQEAAEWLRQRLADYRGRVAESEDALRRYREEHAPGPEPADPAYGVLLREAESNWATYGTLLQRANETGLESVLADGGIRVVDAAETPAAPSSPDLGLLLFLALAGGLAAAAAAMFAAELLDPRLTSAEEVRAHLGQPVLGIVPRTAPGGPDAGRGPLLDALRFARASLVFSPAPRGRRVVAVTSALPGEGKTFLSARLAESLAQTGQRVLLIDADCRRPAVHEHFGVPLRPGLADVLAGNDVLPERTWHAAASNLAVLASGGTVSEAADLLESGRFEALLAESAADFDWILIDTPPLPAAPDAALVAHAAGDVLLVVDAASRSRRPAAAALRQLEAAGARCLGVLLNGVDAPGNPWFTSRRLRRAIARHYSHA